jgi:Fe-coproporphyrin III synthase
MPTNYVSDLVKIGSNLARRKRLGLVIFFVTSACNAKCRTCFYWEDLNQRGDLTWDEIKKLSESMPRFEDFWLSGGEPMLRRELPDILHLFYVNNGIRWTNLPTNGLLPERTAEYTRRICAENPELHLDLNVAMDGLYEMQDSIRSVPGNFKKTLATLEAIQGCRRDFPNLRANINTVICAENLESVLDIAEFVKTNCQVDGHYFNIIRGNALDPNLKRIPENRLPALYRDIQKIYAHYAPTRYKQFEGTKRALVGAYFQGLIAFHNKVQLENIESPHPWPMPCTAGETSVVIDYNGDVRSCELRDKLANLRDFDCNFERFWETQTRKSEVEAIRKDQCWCTHVCFIHDSLRQSPRTLLYDIPVTFLETKFTGRS